MLTIEELKKKKHLHFIGIGGSGMYPIAQILHAKGYYITGSDNNETETLEAVRKMGIEVFLGQRAENIGSADLIVYTAAVLEDNPELAAARKSGAYVAERSEMLGLLTRLYPQTIGVCGTHGKTTATSMLTQIFLEEGVDISCVIGGKLKSIGGSGRVGKSEIMVCESCEFKDHFLKFDVNTAVILNIDADHLDYFGTLDNIKASFRKFADSAQNVIANGDDENTADALKGLEYTTFGFSKDCDFSAQITRREGMATHFDLFEKGNLVREMTIFVPGDHNVLNALAAAAAARSMGVSYDGIEMGLQVFRGAARRFEMLGRERGITVIDDYAHHPAEIASALNAARSLDHNRIWALFQPFTYSRTELLMDDFVQALSIADIAVLTDIMGSREKNDHGIYTEQLGKKLKNSVWFDTPHDVADAQTAQQKEYNFRQAAEYIAQNAQAGDMVITMGCGDVYKAAKLLLEILRSEDS